MTELATIFKLDKARLNLHHGIGFAVVMLVPLIVLGALQEQKYWLSVAFGALFVAMSDQGDAQSRSCWSAAA
jgi:hypothetical protein